MEINLRENMIFSVHIPSKILGWSRQDFCHNFVRICKPRGRRLFDFKKDVGVWGEYPRLRWQVKSNETKSRKEISFTALGSKLLIISTTEPLSKCGHFAMALLLERSVCLIPLLLFWLSLNSSFESHGDDCKTAPIDAAHSGCTPRKRF